MFLQRVRALVMDRQGIRGGLAGSEEDPQAAAVEVGGVAVLYLHAGVDELRAQRFRGAQHARLGEVVEHRVGLARQFASVAEELLVDAVAAAILQTVGGPHGDVVAVAQVSQCRLRLAGIIIVAGRGVDLAVAVHGVAGSVVLAQVDVVIGALGTQVVVVETDHETAGGQTDHGRLKLAAGGELVNPELTAVRRAVGVEALAEHRAAAAVLAAVVVPDDDEIAVREHRHARLVLVIGGGGVDQELATELGARTVEALSIDTDAAAVLRLVGAVHDDKTAVGARRHVGFVLVGREIAADLDFAA